MRNLKRVLSLALALVMVLGMMVITTSAADFTDADEIKQTEAVEVLAELGIVQGANGEFNPNGTFTREAAAKMITYMLIGDKMAEKLSGSDVFTDVAADRWSAGYIAYCANLGYITGVGNDKFNPSGVLKDIELGKLVLCALGYDPAKYTGANWASAVTVDLLEAGLVREVTGEAISREDACAMILAAMTWTDDSDIYTVYIESNDAVGFDEDDTVIKVYTEAVDAYFAASAMGAEVDVDTSDEYLMNEVYGVSCDTKAADIYGRPATVYDHKDWIVPMVYTKKPVATFNTAVTEKDFFAALGAKGEKDVANNNRYITVTKTTEDGRVWIGASVRGVDGTKTYANPGVNMEIDNNSLYRVPGTGEGITVEVYKNSGPNSDNKYTMVCIREYSGTVIGVTKADAVADTKRFVTVALDHDALGHGKNFTIETEDFAFGDKVLVNLTETNGDLYLRTIKAATSISGVITKITDGSIYTIGGVDYVESQLSTATGLALTGRPGTWYVDSCGNIIANESAATSDWNYGYLVNYGYTLKTNNLVGANAVNAEKFEIVTTEGKKVVLDGAFKTNAYGNVTEWKWTANTDVWNVSEGDGDDYSSFSACLVRYLLNPNGEIALIQAVDSVGTDATGAVSLTGPVAKDDATLGTSSVYVTDSTKFIVYGADGTVATYTGYKNIPASTTINGGEYFYAEKIVNGAVVADTTTAAAVVLNVDSTAARTGLNLVWFAGMDKTEVTTELGTVTTFTNVYINGVKGEVKFLGTLPYRIDGVEPEVDPSNSYNDYGPATLYYMTFDADGYAYMIHNGCEGQYAPASAKTSTVEKITSGYFVTDHSTYKTCYTDKNTVYYQVDPITKSFTEVEGLPAMNPLAYNIEIVMWDSVGGTASSASDPATVVVFAVDAK